MPRDANGNFSLVSGYLAVQGQTVQPSNHNPPLEDIASGLTASLPRDGSAPMTSPIKLPDGTSSAPAMTFASDPTKGFYKDANGVQAVGLAGMVPVGGSVMWFTDVLPSGPWTWANGGLIPVANNPVLFAMWAYNWGGSGANMGVPNLQEVVPIGKSTMGGAASPGLLPSISTSLKNNVGLIFGADTHALTGQENGPHSHPNTLTDSGHSHPFTNNGVTGLTGGGVSAFTNGSGGSTGVAGGTVGSNTTGITITNASAGSGTAHNNIQPSQVVNWIIRIG